MSEEQHKITVHVKIIAKDGKIDQLIDAIDNYYKETRIEPGCEYSEVLQNFDDLSCITLVEKFTNYKAFKAHMQMPLFRHFVDHEMKDLTESVKVTFHLTRISCTGAIDKETQIESLSFREDLLNRN